MYSPELLALAPGHIDAMRALATSPRPEKRRLGQASVIGVVQLLGPLDKPELVRAREEVNKFAGDDRVGEIVIIADSPGGTIAGTHDLHLAIANAAKQKRVTAVAEDLCASGAYYAICGASEIVVNTTGIVGSIGVYQVLTDASQLISKNGIEVIVVRAGKYKGTGVFGAKISAEQLEHVQSLVDAQAGHFIAAVARGRKLPAARVRDLADGRILVGQQAIAAGLVDRIATVEDVLEEAESRLQKFMYAQLEGAAAVAKFDAICDAWLTHKAYDRESAPTYILEAAEKSVAAEHPELVATVQKIRERDRQQQEEEAKERSRRRRTHF